MHGVNTKNTGSSLPASATRLAVIAALLVLTAGSGCAQIAYDSLQNSQSLNCQQIQSTSDRNECLQRSNMRYDEYERQRTGRNAD